jgi:hypothetical protein
MTVARGVAKSNDQVRTMWPLGAAAPPPDRSETGRGCRRCKKGLLGSARGAAPAPIAGTDARSRAAILARSGGTAMRASLAFLAEVEQ